MNNYFWIYYVCVYVVYVNIDNSDMIHMTVGIYTCHS